MRFFISASIRENKPLFYLVLFFLLLSLLYLLSSVLDYYARYGFSYERAFVYFFSDLEYPEKPSLALVSENVHINLFLTSIFLLVNLSLFALTNFPDALKPVIVIILSLLGLFHATSDYMVYLFGASFIHVKLFLFVVFTLLSLLLVLYNLVFFLLGKDDKSPGLSLAKLVIGFFSFMALSFVVFNFILFFSKMGFGVSSVKDYYLGNPALFTKPKTLEGMLKSAHPHMLTVPLFVLAVSHFMLFTDRKRQALVFGVLALAGGGFDALGGLLIRYVWEGFSLLKLLSFAVLQLSLLYILAVVLYESFR